MGTLAPFFKNISIDTDVATTPSTQLLDILNKTITDTSDVHNNGSDLGTDHHSFTQNAQLSTGVIAAIAVSSGFVIIILVIAIVFFIRKKCFQKRKAPWEDNLTLSYIADSNFDLTKDNVDDLVSLDNDSFLNSLDCANSAPFPVCSSMKHYNYTSF
ncbi:hypothetical protein CHS0354_002882 [Potamilus streckersoni]|uniref:Uncharacterized protein n=1 Tax=Potamilus streckersoni TaxID=2493646 RepID=A0AAE0SMQ3_9BIVA|nr:hypothetical protein CHS0354_002882 [Potamilus streckersoni]